MNKLFFSALVFSVLSLFSISAYSGEVAIIVNKNNDASISDAELRNLFLGKVTTYSSGKEATPIALQSGDPLTELFSSSVLNRRPSQLKAYWSKMIFTGLATPPKEYSTSSEIIEQVKATASLIGYVDASLVDETVKVIKLVK